MRILISLIFLFLLISTTFVPISYAAKGSRPAYIYDRAGIITDQGESLIDSYLRQVDDSTSAEIVIYTIPSFIGHGIKKNDQEIQDRDMLAYYIFNEVSLDGITGIGKKGKDNGVLILLSLQRDSGGGSMRIEVGRGLEGNITDGTAGAILDSYLVPARNNYEETGSTELFDQAFFDTAVSLGQLTGFVSDNPNLVPSRPVQSEEDYLSDYMEIILILVFFGMIGLLSYFTRRRRGRRGGFYGGGFGGGFGGGGGGGFGGGGGRSGGGGAGR